MAFQGANKRVKPTHINQSNYPPPTPVQDTHTPLTGTTKRLDFDNDLDIPTFTEIGLPQQPPTTTKKKVKVVQSRFLLPPSTPSSSATKPSRGDTSILNDSFQVQSAVKTRPRISRVDSANALPIAASKSDNVRVNSPHTTTVNKTLNNTTAAISATSSSADLKHYLALLNNLLLQYAYCNALGERQFLKRKEKTEKVLFNSYTKIHELRHELHQNKLMLQQYNYLTTLDAVLALQETNKHTTQLLTAFQQYQQVAESVDSTLNWMPSDMAIPPKLFEAFSSMGNILTFIQQLASPTIDAESSPISIAANSLGSISTSVPEQMQNLETCNSLLRILSVIENQLTSLSIQVLEERMYENLK